MRISWGDTEELACAVLGLDDDTDSEKIEETMWVKHELSMEDFQKVAQMLMPFTIQGQSPLTGTKYHGYVKDGAFICKAEADA